MCPAFITAKQKKSEAVLNFLCTCKVLVSFKDPRVKNVNFQKENKDITFIL